MEKDMKEDNGEFEDKYKPLLNDDGTIRFETYGDDFEKAQEAAKNNLCWTIIEGDSGSLWICPGMHFVNRLNYIIATVPYQGEPEDILYFDAEEIEPEWGGNGE